MPRNKVISLISYLYFSQYIYLHKSGYLAFKGCKNLTIEVCYYLYFDKEPIVSLSSLFRLLQRPDGLRLRASALDAIEQSKLLLHQRSTNANVSFNAFDRHGCLFPLEHEVIERGPEYCRITKADIVHRCEDRKAFTLLQ